MVSARRIAGEEDAVLRAATDWLLELQSADISAERLAKWQRWLNQDATHQRAFARVEEMMRIADGLRCVPRPRAAEIAADKYVPDISVSAWKQRHTRRSWRWAPFVLAASVLLAVTVTFVFAYTSGIDIGGVYAFKRIETPAGGTLKLTLPDGSGVDVGGESNLRATFTRGARAVTLQHGEAFFHVAKDTTRPFVVHAGTTSITAVGTAFNVRRSGDRVVVSVAEGVVRVTSPAPRATDPAAAPNPAGESTQLHAGEQLSTERGGAGPVMATIDTNAVAAWRGGRLRYLNEPLESVVADVGRYTARRITIVDAELRELRITSTVLEHNLDGWLLSLEEAFPVHVVREADGEIRLERR